ncbi:GNAT family N-acetyltransferase, partial [Eubacterium sp.]|uniref:GNAT family N-acetyltransferase n=1 Tax=Eubacterium sp. TaxID=142586 RepID=UPI003F089785
RKGYATETLNMLLEEAKNRHIHRVLIGSHASNIGSCKVIEKCGFKFEEEIIDPYNLNEMIKKYSKYIIF